MRNRRWCGAHRRWHSLHAAGHCERGDYPKADYSGKASLVCKGGLSCAMEELKAFLRTRIPKPVTAPKGAEGATL